MATTLGEAILYLRGDDKGLESSLGGAKTKTESFASSATKLLGGALVAGAVAAGAAIIGIGKAALDVEGEFKLATDALINGTGASGDALADMEERVRSLKTSSAGLGKDYETIGATMAEVNTRTGLTGEALESLTGEVLKFSRLTGADAVDATQKLTRVMGDWGVQNEDSAALLDQLYGAGQAFGIGFDDLSSKVVQFGAPLRQMGFGLEESIALFGKWEKEGVNAELAIGSLRIAAGGFARDGVDLAEGLKDVQERIKGAANESEALTIAMKTFGARAGPDMAAAIREGRFELDSAIESLRATEGGLNDAAERTLGFREKWEISMSKVTDSMLPLGEKLGDLALRAMPMVIAAVEAVVSAIGPLIDWIVKATDTITAFATSSNPAMVSVRNTVKSVVDYVIALFSGFRASVDENATGPLAYWKEWADANLPRLQTLFQNVLTGIRALWEVFGPAIELIAGTAFSNIWAVIDTVMRNIGDLVTLSLQLLTGDWEGAGQTLEGIVTRMWGTISNIFINSLNTIIELIDMIDWEAVGEAIVKGIMAGMQLRWNPLRAWWDNELRRFHNLLPFSEPKDSSSPLANLGKAGESIIGNIQRGMESEMDGLRNGFASGLGGFASGLGSQQPVAAAGGGMNIVVNVSGDNATYEAGRAVGRGIQDELRKRGF